MTSDEFRTGLELRCQELESRLLIEMKKNELLTSKLARIEKKIIEIQRELKK